MQRPLKALNFKKRNNKNKTILTNVFVYITLQRFKILDFPDNIRKKNNTKINTHVRNNCIPLIVITVRTVRTFI